MNEIWRARPPNAHRARARMAQSSADKYAYENKVAERFGGQTELELVVPTLSYSGYGNRREWAIAGGKRIGLEGR